MIDGGPQRFAISLGAFQTEAAAQAWLDALSDTRRQERQGRRARAGSGADRPRRARPSGARGRAPEGTAGRLSGHRNQGRHLRQGSLTDGGARDASRNDPGAALAARHCARPRASLSNTRDGSRSISVFRASSRSWRACRASMRRRAGACCSPGRPRHGLRLHRLAPARRRLGCGGSSARSGRGPCRAK